MGLYIMKTELSLHKENITMTMKTVETELRKYRMCRAEMVRGCDVVCGECPHNILGSLMWRFSHIDAEISGEQET